MKERLTLTVEVDNQGRFILPAEIGEQYGFTPGTTVRLDKYAAGFHISVRWDGAVSPCIICNSCEMASSNKKDCFGYTQLTCGGCLWGQGFIQCP